MTLHKSMARKNCIGLQNGDKSKGFQPNGISVDFSIYFMIRKVKTGKCLFSGSQQMVFHKKLPNQFSDTNYLSNLMS